MKLIAPVAESACRIPTAAEALCRTAVKAAPTTMPTSGWEKVVRRARNCGLSFSGETAPLIVCMPNISTVKPSMISLACLVEAFFAVMRTTMPTMANSAAIVEVDSSEASPPLSPR